MMSDYYCTGGQTAGSGCGCGQQGVQGTQSCGCGQQNVQGLQNCTCSQPSVQGTQTTPQNCGCRDCLVQALQMLLRSGLSAYLDFTLFAFVTSDVVVGANLIQPDTTLDTYDNLADVLDGTFSGFTPGACNYIDVSGAAYAPTPSPTVAGCLNGLLNAVIDNAETTASTELATLVTALTALVGQTTVGSATFNAALVDALNTALTCGVDTGLLVSRLSLCTLLAIAFEPLGDTATVISANYAAARQMMINIIQPPCQTACPPYPDPCCCSDYAGAGRTLSLSVGPLQLAGVVVLGKIGNVLVLANDAEQRFYFVCADDATIIR